MAGAILRVPSGEPSLPVTSSLHPAPCAGESPAPRPLSWRTLVTGPRRGAENMALDEALMSRAAATGEAVLRVYQWSRPTLSLGRNQTARGRYDLERIRSAGVDVVRRPTGGRAVLHHREVTYSVTAPEGVLGPLREAYHAINGILLRALAALGVAATEAPALGVAPRPGTAPCFEEPVAGEIVARGRKLVGSAQVREHGALLQHGSILVEDDQALASRFLLRAGPPLPPPATLLALLGHAPSFDRVAACLCDALDGATPLPLDGALLALARTRTPRYDDPAWTWRR